MTRKALIFVAVLVVGLSTALWPLDAAAQRRGGGGGGGGGHATATPRGGGQAPSHPVAGPGPSGQAHAVPRTAPPYGSRYYGGYRPYYGGYPYYYHPYYAPYTYSPYYWGSGWGWGFGVGFGFGYGAGYGYYQYPYPWGYPYPYPYSYPYYSYDPTADLRLQVQPRNAEVYLDSYYVGTVDDFDGTFQRLHVPYGEHEVEVYLEGFRPIRQRMMFRPGESYNMKDAMQQLAPGEASEPRPVAPQSPPRQPRQPQQPYPPPQPYAPQEPYPPQTREREPMGPPPQRPMEQADRGTFGTLAIRVQPADAEIMIDGERWNTPEGESHLSVDLAEGTHRIEIRKAGFRPYLAEIRINRGEMLPLNVSLPKSN